MTSDRIDQVRQGKSGRAEFDRRRFLAGVLVGGGVAVVGSGILNSSAAGATAANSETGTDLANTALGGSSDSSTAPTVIYQSYSVDGQLPKSARGSFVGTSGGSLVISPIPGNGRTQLGEIEILLTGKTKVFAHGTMTLGDSSNCQPGDMLFIGTFFDPSQSRVAEFVYSNPFVDKANILSVDGPVLRYQSRRLANNQLPSTDTPPVYIMPFTWYSGSALGSSAASPPISPGDSYQILAMGDIPGSPTQLWAMNLSQLIYPG